MDTYIEEIKKYTSADTKKAYVRSFGCQLNISDGEKIKGLLKKWVTALPRTKPRLI